MHYILFVDESGDQGLDVVRDGVNDRGASPFMTLGAALVPMKDRSSLEEMLESLCSEFRKDLLHCSELNHFQNSYFARQASKERIKLFGVISKKSTLGSYRSEIKGERQSQFYYNKCSQYLLELVGKFLKLHSIGSSDLTVIFERKNHNYQALRSYIKNIRNTPIDSRAFALREIDPLSIIDRSKKEEPLLSLADLVAFSLFQSVNESSSNFGIPEQRYLREIIRKFHRDPATGKVANFGIKYVKGPMRMGLSGGELSFALKQYKACKPQ